MPADPIEPSRFGQRRSLRSRATAAALALAVLAVIGLALLRLGAMAGEPGGKDAHLTSVALSSDSSTRKRAERHAETRAKHAAAVNPRPQPVPTAVPTHPPLNLIPLSHAEFAAADIGRMARHEEDSGASSGDSKAAYGPGEGPGGARLFNAEWYREPSDAELAGYMPPTGAPQGSWATIACKTVEHFHVDSCIQLDESPPGSGLSRALRQAAWQFLVRPPRIDGKPMVGSWVRIRFDFSRRAGD